MLTREGLAVAITMAVLWAVGPFVLAGGWSVIPQLKRAPTTRPRLPCTRGEAREAPIEEDLKAMLLDLVEGVPAMEFERRQDPTTGEWRLDPVVSELRDFLDSGGTMPEEVWDRALRSSGAIRMRSTWPSSEPLAVSLRLPRWLSPAVIELDPRTPGLTRAQAGEPDNSLSGIFTRGWERAALYQELGLLAPGRHRILFDVTVWRNHRTWRSTLGYQQAGALYWEGEMAWEVDIVERPDQAVRPASGLQLEHAVRDSLGIAFDDWYIEGEWKRTAILVVDPAIGEHPLLRSVALSLEIELLHGGSPLENLHMIASAYDRIALANSVEDDPRAIAFARLDLPPVLENDLQAREAWTLRVRGTHERVLPIWEAESYWSGEVELPIGEVIEWELERSRPDGRGPWVSSPR